MVNIVLYGIYFHRFILTNIKFPCSILTIFFLHGVKFWRPDSYDLYFLILVMSKAIFLRGLFKEHSDLLSVVNVLRYKLI